MLSKKEIEDLILTHIDYSDALSNKISQILKRNSVLDIEDYIQAGRRGLIEAARAWNPIKSKSVFKSFLYFRIKGAIIDELRRIERGRHNKKYVSHYEIPVENPIDFDKTSYINEFEESLSNKKIIKNLIEKAKLNEREILILQKYYYDDLTMKEISKIMFMTTPRISQLHTKIIGKMTKASYKAKAAAA